MDHYSKTPTAITTSKGTAFTQSGKKNNNKKGDKDKEKSDTAKDPKAYDKETWKDKECLRCGKKGHPVRACPIKPLGDNDDGKSSRSTSSTKSTTSTSLNKIQKSFKAMGKALAQIGEGAESDNDSFGDQSHVMLAVSNVQDARSGYSFAVKKQSIRQQLLLDSCSSTHIMCNPAFVTNIREAGRTVSLKSNGSTLTINKIADFKGFEEEVWFSTDAMTNILSFALVRAEYNISYDGEAFIVHRSDNRYNDMVFIPHSSGLHVYNPDDPRGLASYSFFETVESNM